MEDRIEGLKDGIIACFDLLTELRGEEVAVIYSEAPAQAADPTVSEVDNENDLTSDPGSSSSSGASSEANGITFMEIQYAYQSVAAQLRFRFGVAVGDTVLVICKGQAAAEIVAMLACMKVGATFVPVDNSWVTAGTRLRDIVEDTRPSAAIVVADSDNDPCVLALAAVGLYRCVYLNDNGDIVESFNTLRDDSGFAVDTYSYDSVDEAEPGVAVTEAHPLYILCTSGSTGRPKGVLGTHKGLLSRIAWQWRRFPFAPGEVVCRRTPLVFVDSMAEIFSALLSLTPLWCPPKQRLVAEGIGGIASEANEAGVSRVTLLPSQLQQALSLYPDLGDTWQSLKTIFVSGEECTAGLVRAVKERLPEVTLVNLYGSTEVAGDVSFAVLAAADGTAVDTEGAGVMPIGEPIEGNFLLVVSVGDAHTPLRLLPDGEVGELMVVGTHLALGYDYVDPSGSAKFIDNPLRRFGEAGTELGSKVSPEASEYERAYMTGDLAYRSTQDGLFYLCGRKDRQVKIRGVRIELEDVERQACKALGLDDGVVVLAVAPDASAGDAANAAILVAVLDDQSLTKSGRPSTESIRRRLQEALVPSMVPAIVLTVQAFPRNTTGKLDRRPLQRQVEDTFPTGTGTGALPGQSHGAAASSVEQLRSALSDLTLSEWLQEIVRIYTEVLGVSAPEGSIDSVDFFALGGDSVRMIEVLWRLRLWTGLSVGPAELRLPVGELAVRLRSQLSSGAPGMTLLRHVIISLFSP
jgi:iturin family lipopeptide synthetase A